MEEVSNLPKCYCLLQIGYGCNVTIFTNCHDFLKDAVSSTTLHVCFLNHQEEGEAIAFRSQLSTCQTDLFLLEVWLTMKLRYVNVTVLSSLQKLTVQGEGDTQGHKLVKK